MIVSIVITAALVLSASATTVCTPNYLLSQTIHDTAILSSFNTSNALTQAVYTYTYFQNLFTGQPKVIFSYSAISQLQSNQFSELNYQLTAQMAAKSINFYFTSKAMNWTSLQVQFLLHSRSDLFSNIETISIMELQKNATVSYQVPHGNSSASYIFTHFIIGIVAPQANQYDIGIKSFSVSGSQYQIVAFCNKQAALTIQTIYFNSAQVGFSYSFNQFTLSPSSSPQYKTLWADFAPTIYTLFGFSKMKISGSVVSISSTFDLVSNVFTVDSMNGLSSASLAFFAIGELPSDVCSPCNNFISISGCLDVCPNNSYAQNLVGGGKTCRFCNSNLGQTLNTQSDSCICANGLKYFQGNCYKSNELPLNCSSNQVLIDGLCYSLNSNARCQSNEVYDTKASLCVCTPNYERVSGVCVQSCVKNSLRNNNGICICFSGFLMNSQHQCESICQANSYFNSTSATCICNPNFQLKNGACTACSQSQTYDPNSRTCVAKSVLKVGTTASVVTITCQSNEVIVNNTCQCDQNSIKNNNKCIQCPPATFKASNTQCALCSSYCASCQSNTTCQECHLGFQFNGSVCAEVCGDGKKYILPCDDGNTVNGDGCSSTCLIETGYVCNGGNENHADTCTKLKPNAKISISIGANSPTYVSAGIFTDFILQPPIERTREELHNLFMISFSNPQAKPKGIALSQSNSDLTSIRCFFSYNNNLPNNIFQAFFTVQDFEYGRDSITIMYNTLSNPVKSAIDYLQGTGQDILS